VNHAAGAARIHGASSNRGAAVAVARRLPTALPASAGDGQQADGKGPFGGVAAGPPSGLIRHAAQLDACNGYGGRGVYGAARGDGGAGRCPETDVAVRTVEDPSAGGPVGVRCSVASVACVARRPVARFPATGQCFSRYPRRSEKPQVKD
jgi:hypothetical protein